MPSKGPCNKLPDKSVSICTTSAAVHCNEMQFSECYPVHCLALLELWFDRELSDPSCRRSLALKPVDIRH